MRITPIALALLSAQLASCGRNSAAKPGRISEFGRYEGYSDSLYSQWVRTSEYVTMRDGTRLAVDIIRPAVNGVAVDRKLPVVWTFSRYHRTDPPVAAIAPSHDVSGLARGAYPKAAASDFTTPDSTGKLPFASAPSIVDGSRGYQRLIKHGYVLVSAQVRGGGSSFGRYEGLFSPVETRDGYDLMDWMVKQAWCDGNLGMAGGSYLGITQYMAASTRHPALKAIFPRLAAFSMYDFIYTGGIYRENMMQHWGLLTRSLDVSFAEPPVDGDSTGKIRAAAIAEHAGNWNVIDEIRAARFRDHDTPGFAYSRHEPAVRIEAMNQSGVAAYHWGGWYDTFAKDELLWLANWTGVDRLTMGPWSHDLPDQVVGAEIGRVTPPEQHRWFDRWLKGIKNGIDTEPPIRYALVDDGANWRWKTASHWPPAEAKTTTFHLVGGPSGSVASSNDGLLQLEPAAKAGSDSYRVDPTTTLGSATRWDNAVAQGPMRYPDMAPNDAKSLTWTTAPLTANLAMVGHPVITLYGSSDRSDADFHVVLSEVDDKGVARYVSEGMLRGSQRDTTTAPWNNLGLPWHRAHAADARPMVPGQVVPLVFDLQPTATLFNAGHRLRITVMGADADNTEPSPAGRPTIRIYHGPEHLSAIRFPTVPID